MMSYSLPKNYNGSPYFNDNFALEMFIKEMNFLLKISHYAIIYFLMKLK
jgi:hypothetical protein